MGKGKGSKNKSAKDKKSGSHQSSAQFDWGTVLNNGPIRLDQITMRDNQKKTIWQVIAEKNHSWSENLEALSESLQIKSVILSRINELLPEQKINALGHAIKADHVQAASTLLRLGADIRCAFADAPWLHALLHHCQEPSDIISLLDQCEKQELVIDATLQCQVDQHNRSLHHYALVQHNSEQLVQWLLDHCLYAHHPIQNNPILLWLITHKKNHLLNRYIERSPASQVYAYDQKGKNCLFHACQVGDLELVRTLLWHHSNIHTCNPKGENALHILAKVSEFKHVHQNILRLLIISGMDITKIDHNGDSPLMIALRHKQAEMIPTILLISDLYQINHRGEHCLSLALCSGMFDIAQVIISRHRKTPNQPFDMEQRAIQLPKAYVDQCQSQYFSIHGQQLTIDMTQKASPLSLVILGNCLFDMSCMRVLTELLDRQLEAIDHEDDPYYFAMATQNPGIKSY